MRVITPTQQFTPTFHVSSNFKTDIDTRTALISLDETLTKKGLAADAKAVGDALEQKQPIGDYLKEEDLPDWVKEEEKPEYNVDEINGLQEKINTFVFKQLTPTDKWIITHNLNKFPTVTIIDSGNNVVVGDVVYLNEKTIEIHFIGAFSGKAYLN